jgi:zinc transporter ZupT
MTLLIVSLISLAIAPWLYGALHRWRTVHNLLDTLLLLIVAAIVLVEVLWDSYRDIGWLGPLIGIVGLAVPSLIEQVSTRLALPTHRLTAVLGIAALVLHSIMDGATLAIADQQLLAWAVVLHQLPLGLAVWWLIRHASGVLLARLVLAGMIAATIGGFVLTQHIIPWLNDSTNVALQAFLAGSLLHVLVHRHKPHHDHAEHEAHDH